MKCLKVNSLLLVLGLFLLANNGYSGNRKKVKTDFAKTFEKSVAINPNAKVELSNQFGKIHITSGSTNQVELKVEITVEASDETKAQKKLDQITIQWEASEELVKARTSIGGRGNQNVEKLEINYTVALPKTAELKVENKFGSVYLNEMVGKTVIDLSYGSLQAGELRSSESSIELAFGKADIELFNGKKLDIEYAEGVSITRANNLKVDSRFSKLTIEELNDLNIDSQYDQVKLGTCRSVKADNQFSHLKIQYLGSELLADHRYGSLKVLMINKEFTAIKVDSDFSNVDLSFASGSGMTMDIDIAFGNMDCPNSWNVQMEQDDNKLSKEFKGSVGGGGGSLIVDLSYGKLELNEV
ncbi:MAG: hypothetical protein ACFB10_12830 [Salibacteraceae bacterium]